MTTDSELPLVAAGSNASLHVESGVCLKTVANPCGLQLIGRQGHLLWPLLSQYTHTHTHTFQTVLPHSMHTLVKISIEGSPPPSLCSPWHDLPSWTSCRLQRFWPSLPFPSSGITHTVYTCSRKRKGKDKDGNPHVRVSWEMIDISDALHQSRKHWENRSNINCEMAL